MVADATRPASAALAVPGRPDLSRHSSEPVASASSGIPATPTCPVPLTRCDRNRRMGQVRIVTWAGGLLETCLYGPNTLPTPVLRQQKGSSDESLHAQHLIPVLSNGRYLKALDGQPEHLMEADRAGWQVRRRQRRPANVGGRSQVQVRRLVTPTHHDIDEHIWLPSDRRPREDNRGHTARRTSQRLRVPFESGGWCPIRHQGYSTPNSTSSMPGRSHSSRSRSPRLSDTKVLNCLFTSG